MKMRDLVWSICLLFSISIAAQAESVSRGSREHVMAWKNGARSKFTFQVVDMDGMPIEQASIKASFGKEWGGWIDGIADSNGLFTIEHKSAGEMIYNVKKNKYYPTEGKFCFGGEENVVIKDGKWLPWNPTNTVVLKEIKNAVAMYVRCDDMHVPEIGKPVAYDVERGDWVAPHGSGRIPDIIVLYEYKGIDPWTFSKRLSLSFGTNALDGIQRREKDIFSMFNSAYEAPVDMYEKTVFWEFERTKTNSIGAWNTPADEYYIFRVRTEVDDKGHIVKANYGKIYGPIDYGNGGNQIHFSCYFNPEVNSRSLEFDPQRNLSGQKIPSP